MLRVKKYLTFSFKKSLCFHSKIFLYLHKVHRRYDYVQLDELTLKLGVFPSPVGVFLCPLEECHGFSPLLSLQEGQGDVEAAGGLVGANIWSLTQFYSVDYLVNQQSVWKFAFSTSALSRLVSAVLNIVLRSPWLRRHVSDNILDSL